MGQIPLLEAGDPFPPSFEAMETPNGLLAAGGGLSPTRLLNAYSKGLFPWYEQPQPVLWWTPDPRSVLFPDELHISRSLRKTLRADTLSLAVDTRFNQVMFECGRARGDDRGSWIGPDMISAYTELHQRGFAHSVEVLDGQGNLVGGLYGVALGRVFFGESMFSRVDDASKVALVALVWMLRRSDFQLIDCQVENPHLNSLGARNISRLDFEGRLGQTISMTIEPDTWQVPATCGGLL